MKYVEVKILPRFYGLYLNSAGWAGAPAQVPWREPWKGCGRSGGPTQRLALAGKNKNHNRLKTPQTTNIRWVELTFAFFPLRSLFSTDLDTTITTPAEDPWSTEAGLWQLLTVWTGSITFDWNTSLRHEYPTLITILTSFLWVKWKKYINWSKNSWATLMGCLNSI